MGQGKWTTIFLKGFSSRWSLVRGNVDPFGVHAFSPLQTVELLVPFIGLESFSVSGNVKFSLHNPFIFFMMNLQWICAFSWQSCGKFIHGRTSTVNVLCVGDFSMNLQWICACYQWICCKFMHLSSSFVHCLWCCWGICLFVYPVCSV